MCDSECQPVFFPLLELPKPPLIEVMRIVNREDRRALLQTCWRLRALLIGSKDPTLDTRKTLEWCTVDSEQSGIHFKHSKSERREEFRDVPAFEQFIREFQRKYFVRKIVCHCFSAANQSLILEAVSQLSDAVTVFCNSRHGYIMAVSSLIRRVFRQQIEAPIGQDIEKS